MSESIERHTTTVATGEDGTVTRVTHTSVRVSASGDCFDPERCCDERERALMRPCVRICARSMPRRV